MSRLDLEQIEQLKEIGAYLLQERQVQAKSLEQVAAETFISVRLLRAIEEGQADSLPEPIFVQGFIRRYADNLGLDGIAIAKNFSTVSAPVEPEVLVETPVEEPPILSRSNRLAYVAAGVLAGIAVLGGLAYSLTQRSQVANVTARQQNVAPAKPAQPSTQKSTQTTQAANPAAAKPAKPAPSSPSVEVAVKFTGESWVQVVADGRVVFEDTLSQGTQKTWTAKKQLTLQAGNAGAVVVSFKQGEPKRLGEPGEVKEVTFTGEMVQAIALP